MFQQTNLKLRRAIQKLRMQGAVPFARVGFFGTPPAAAKEREAWGTPPNPGLTFYHKFNRERKGAR